MNRGQRRVFQTTLSVFYEQKIIYTNLISLLLLCEIGKVEKVTSISCPRPCSCRCRTCAAVSSNPQDCTVLRPRTAPYRSGTATACSRSTCKQKRPKLRVRSWMWRLDRGSVARHRLRRRNPLKLRKGHLTTSPTEAIQKLLSRRPVTFERETEVFAQYGVVVHACTGTCTCVCVRTRRKSGGGI